MQHIAHKVRTYNSAIKTILILTFLGVVGYQLFYREDLTEMWSELMLSVTGERVWLLLLVIVLMPFNWLFEARKWKLLMRPALDIPFARSLRAILSGVAISLFTPNRIGEYGGRILYVPSKYNWRAVLATLVGSFAQNLVHITFGLVVLVMLIAGNAELPGALENGMVVLLAIVLLILYIAYANVARISSWLRKIKPSGLLKRPWRALGHLEKIQPQDLRIALGYSLARYLLFSTQFVLLILFFGIDVPLEWIIGAVVLMFLLQTSVPLPPFMDVVARTELAILLWASFDVNELAVVSASFFLWIINLLIPSFFGLIAMSKVDVLQSLGYEENAQKAASPDSDNTGLRINRVAGDD